MKKILDQFIRKIFIKIRIVCKTYYIHGSETLPPALSKPEEAELLDCLRHGDDSVRQTLIERNLRLVVYIARKFENTGIGIEDLVSIGTIGLIKGVKTFDVFKNIKLATYASRCIENEILMYLRKNMKTKYEVSFDEPLNVDWDGNELLLSDIMGTDIDLVTNEVETGIEKELLQDAVLSLNQREKDIMQLRFGINKKEEKTQKEVADILGISQSYISRLEKRIIKKISSDIKKTI
jgi:RNA polymerase sporulation-specific sigma factor